MNRRDLLKTAALLLLPRCGSAPAMDAPTTYRTIETTGLPDHATGMFPNPNCPGPIRENDRTLRVTMKPVANESMIPIQAWEFGVADNGVSLDPAGPWFKGDPTSGWHFEVTSKVASGYLGLDDNHAHTQPNGKYHYHALPDVLLTRGDADRAAGRMHLLGWAADGFPIYSPYGHSVADDLASPLIELRSGYELLSGARPSGGPGGSHDGTFVQDYEWREGVGELDAANSRFGATPEFPRGTVYYVFSNAFPFIPRMWRGTPDPSFANPIGPVGDNGLPPALRDYTG